MTDLSADMLMRHEREFGAIGARLDGLATGHATTRADFKDALADMRSDLKEGVASIRDEVVRQVGHMRGESAERIDRLEAALEAFGTQMDRQREAEQKRADQTIQTLKEAQEAAQENVRDAQKINRGIIVAIGALLIGAQQFVEHVLPALLSISP